MPQDVQSMVLVCPPMNTGFFYHRDRLTCDGVPLETIVEAVSTPVYVYSTALICERFRELDAAFGDYPHGIHYAFKANSTLALVRLLRQLGSRVDANSIGEVEVALRAGFDPVDIVLTGVGKTSAELSRAVALGIKAINVESAGELERIAALAAAQHTRSAVAVRVNPDIDAQSHPHISTALRASKFGVPMQETAELCRAVSQRPELRLVGLHVHVGSQIVTLDPLVQATEALVSLARELVADGIALEHLDLGGGLGIAYDQTEVPRLADYAAALLALVRPSGLEVCVEPGRAIVGPAGVLIARVVDTKRRGDGRELVVLDAGMTELLRPALYKARHSVMPLEHRSTVPIVCDVVGPVCESSDVFGAGYSLSRPEVGDLMAILDAGAYGASMASNYNRHLLPPEVTVDQGQWRVVRRRQTIDDILDLEG